MMNKCVVATVVLSIVFLSACDVGSKQATSSSEVVSASAKPPKGSISHNRTKAFKAFKPNFLKLGKVVKGEMAYHVEEYKALAATFAQEAREPFEFFASDPNGNGDALPAIWKQPKKFEAKRDELFAAADALNEAAKTAKLENIRREYERVLASCKACHLDFRRPKNNDK